MDNCWEFYELYMRLESLKMGDILFDEDLEKIKFELTKLIELYNEAIRMVIQILNQVSSKGHKLAGKLSKYKTV